MAPETPETPTPATDETPTPTPTEGDVGTETSPETPSFGLNAYAERINGRFAMIGFVALLLVELITHQTFFEWIGF